MNFRKRRWYFTASSIRKEQLTEWIGTFWEEHWKTGQKEEGAGIWKAEGLALLLKGSSWEPPGLLKVDP